MAYYWSQLKTRTKVKDEWQQVFAAVVEQMEHWALTGLSEDVIQREASCAFHHGMEGWEIKQCLIMGGEWTLNKAFNQAPKLETANAAGRSSVKLRKLRTGSTIHKAPPD
jgi:hypothetical protein